MGQVVALAAEKLPRGGGEIPNLLSGSGEAADLGIEPLACLFVVAVSYTHLNRENTLTKYTCERFRNLEQALCLPVQLQLSLIHI